MKKIIWFCTVSLLLIACSDNYSSRNPYLSEVSFTKTINLNLPSYNNLTVAGSGMLIEDATAGIKGILVINQGFNQFLAWEASCPNHTPSSCSTMEVTGNIYCQCDCDDYKYSLYTGNIIEETNDGNAEYSLLYYQTSVNGNILTISN
ncbi:hypothetical protein NBRC110019_16860 [Neptunitalea chrysea]|uniref:Rieske domain-containing protein n=1 Tax=Neptunitalea chrysea TaxID=1647581 RepID=A0A9W6B502_9FLAO|nr:hypothetical protein [Neptunitalea chrysea]GLB52646.1 hypothetical protein NBRC110019_16860 [Neptunitalea chrysea]